MFVEFVVFGPSIFYTWALQCIHRFQYLVINTIITFGGDPLRGCGKGIVVGRVPPPVYLVQDISEPGLAVLQVNSDSYNANSVKAHALDKPSVIHDPCTFVIVKKVAEIYSLIVSLNSIIVFQYGLIRQKMIAKNTRDIIRGVQNRNINFIFKVEKIKIKTKRTFK